MSDLVEFRHLKYIVAVAETANFTRAAERLFLAQPSLSKQIKDLEDEIGFPIFLRNRDGVRITPAGQMIIAYAQEALAARVEIMTMARAVHKGEGAPFRLGFSPFVNPELLEFFRNAYSSLFPSCPIHLSGGDSSHILQRLEQENLDAALLPMPVESLDWVTQELARDPLVVCMRTDDALAHAPEVSISDLSAKLKIFRDPEIHPTAHDRLVELLTEVGIDPEASRLAATPLIFNGWFELGTESHLLTKEPFGPALILQGCKILIENAAVLRVLRIGQMYQAIWIVIRQWAQNYRLDDAENRGVDTDAQAKCKETNSSVTGRPAQLAKSKADVLPQYLKNWQATLNAIPLLRLNHPTKLTLCRSSGHLFGHAAFQVIFYCQLDMRAQLLVKVLI
jgi:DNA-binding transcriptional LysR family regulator